jgi:hypothetical protein
MLSPMAKNEKLLIILDFRYLKPKDLIEWSKSFKIGKRVKKANCAKSG